MHCKNVIVQITYMFYFIPIFHYGLIISLLKNFNNKNLSQLGHILALMYDNHPNFSIFDHGRSTLVGY